MSRLNSLFCQLGSSRLIAPVEITLAFGDFFRVRVDRSYSLFKEMIDMKLSPSQKEAIRLAIKGNKIPLLKELSRIDKTIRKLSRIPPDVAYQWKRSMFAYLERVRNHLNYYIR